VAKGARVSPLGAIAFDESTLSIEVSQFWQEYPSALRLTPNVSTIALFAEMKSAVHELQPGERKRRKFSIHVDDSRDPASWLSHRLPRPDVVNSGAPAAEHFLRALNLSAPFDQELASLVIPAGAFLNKREIIDEYGWRNFGDVFADHESLYRQPEEAPLVSHYNNQYDLILGFGLQYLRTKDRHWLELMNDLARHVSDIDVYHTSEDRIEYNGGLFWHTNHYQDAGTATHRTFSRMNYDPADPSGGSGGPGPEHCYTTGLTLHHFMTGDAASRAVVLGLAAWMRDYFRGDSTLFGQLHSVAKRELPQIVKLLKRRENGSYSYPLTRATGNLIVAYLDAHALTGDHEWIDAASSVLENTFHADDDPDTRGLDDVENTWSHTVFLQAVLRYLALKESLQAFDSAYESTKQAFLTYAMWTMEHAEPYLETPERLEFVNDTWAAQDIRRCILMYAAMSYDESNAIKHVECISQRTKSRCEF